MQHFHTEQGWAEQSAQEQKRLLAQLGTMPEGGIVETLQHIGATSVPGAAGQPIIDIALAVWPFPLEPPRLAALEVLGYKPVPGYQGEPEQRFRHETGAFQLQIVEAGSDRWTEFVIVRDHLRDDGQARERYNRQKQSLLEAAPNPAAYENAKAELFREMVAPAETWWVRHHGFAPVRAVAEEFAGFAHPWYISSGWSIDLFLGQVNRVHHDVDVVFAFSDQLALYEHMTGRGWKFVTPLDGRLEPWPPHMRLELPRHQAHAHRDGAFIDVLLSDIAGGVWRYRRDPVVIRGVERMAMHTADGLPFLAPEIALLFKSKNTSNKERGKDQADFERTRDALEPERRAWLRWALLRSDPEHPWISQLV